MRNVNSAQSKISLTLTKVIGQSNALFGRPWERERGKSSHTDDGVHAEITWQGHQTRKLEHEGSAEHWGFRRVHVECGAYGMYGQCSFYDLCCMWDQDSWWCPNHDHLYFVRPAQSAVYYSSARPKKCPTGSLWCRAPRQVALSLILSFACLRRARHGLNTVAEVNIYVSGMQFLKAYSEIALICISRE